MFGLVICLLPDTSLINTVFIATLQLCAYAVAAFVVGVFCPTTDQMADHAPCHVGKLLEQQYVAVPWILSERY